MYRSILVPLDGSAFGENALPFARTIAQASGATLHLAQAARLWGAERRAHLPGMSTTHPESVSRMRAHAEGHSC